MSRMTVNGCTSDPIVQVNSAPAATLPVSNPILRLEDVSKSYPVSGGSLWGSARNARVLDHVDLEIGVGEILGLTGRSGAGKSTLARILAWMEAPDTGSVVYLGQTWKHGNIPAGVRRQVQYVFQNPALSLNPRMTAWQQLIEAPLYHRLSHPAGITKRMMEIVSVLGLEGPSLSRYPHEFSGGQQQRLALARALSVEPQLLICDEATSSLDSRNAAELVSLLQRINREMGVTILFVSHDRQSVSRLCQRVVKLSDGKLEAVP